MISKDEQEYRMQETIALIERYLPLNKWNYKEDSRYFYNGKYPNVIYVSAVCGVKFYSNAFGERTLDHLMLIYYGTLGVPDQADSVRVGHFDNHHLLWHSAHYPLHFFEGLSAKDAYRKKEPDFVKDFNKSKAGQKHKYHPEKNLAMNAAIWETYGLQLFNLFSMTDKSLWKQYSTFIKEYWEVLRSPNS